MYAQYRSHNLACNMNSIAGLGIGLHLEIGKHIIAQTTAIGLPFASLLFLHLFVIRLVLCSLTILATDQECTYNPRVRALSPLFSWQTVFCPSS